MPRIDSPRVNNPRANIESLARKAQDKPLEAEATKKKQPTDRTDKARELAKTRKLGEAHPKALRSRMASLHRPSDETTQALQEQRPAQTKREKQTQRQKAAIHTLNESLTRLGAKTVSSFSISGTDALKKLADAEKDLVAVKEKYIPPVLKEYRSPASHTKNPAHKTLDQTLSQRTGQTLDKLSNADKAKMDAVFNLSFEDDVRRFADRTRRQPNEDEKGAYAKRAAQLAVSSHINGNHTHAVKTIDKATRDATHFLHAAAKGNSPEEISRLYTEFSRTAAGIVNAHDTKLTAAMPALILNKAVHDMAHGDDQKTISQLLDQANNEKSHLHHATKSLAQTQEQLDTGKFNPQLNDTAKTNWSQILSPKTLSRSLEHAATNPALADQHDIKKLQTMLDDSAATGKIATHDKQAAKAVTSAKNSIEFLASRDQKNNVFGFDEPYTAPPPKPPRSQRATSQDQAPPKPIRGQKTNPPTTPQPINRTETEV